MKPVARTDRLIKQVVDQDTLVYDPADDTACCLNSLASLVWRHCDGEHSVEAIAAVVAKEHSLPFDVDAEDVVWQVLDELEAHHLLAESRDGVLHDALDLVRRRDLVKLLAAIPLFPAIQGITAPIAKNTTSPAPTPTPSTSAPSASLSQTPLVTQSVTPTKPSVSLSGTLVVSQSMTPTPTQTPTQTVPPPSASHTPVVTPSHT